MAREGRPADPGHPHPTYTILDHTGDFAFEVVAPDLAGLVSSAVLAAADAMFGRQALRPVEVVELVADATDREMLLFRVLSEFVFIFDARGLIPCGVEVEEEGTQLRVRLWCDALDPARHRPAVVFKAPTLHALEVEAAEGGGLRARIVMDT
jgi:SHS2 domain-containing protein